MKRTWTIIGVDDVARSFRWYQSLLGLPASAPAHDHFGQILDADGTVLLCLHQWGAHDHPTLTSPAHAAPGNGLLLFLRVDDFDLALRRARTLVEKLDEEPQVNPNTGTREFSLRDPDGYYVTISALSANGNVAVLEALAAAFNRHDLDAIMELFAEDCALDMPRGRDPWGTRYTGKADVRRALQGRFEMLPDVHYGDARHFAAERMGISEWLLTGTLPSGQAIAVRGCDHYEFRDGMVVRKDSYWKIVD